MSTTPRRTGAETRAQAQRVALSLFTTQGYEATSMRQIADELGINKASLYYHFASKEDIVRATMAGRSAEADALLAWAAEQPPADDLLERTVLRWVDSFSVEKLRGIRLLNANPLLMRTMAGDGARIGDSLAGIVALFCDGSDPVREVQVRMAFLTINAAVAAGAGFADDDVVRAARESSLAILERLHLGPQAPAARAATHPPDGVMSTPAAPASAVHPKPTTHAPSDSST